MFDREDSTARNLAISSVFWLVVVISYGLILATEFVAPDFLRGIPAFVYPRVRQAHVNGLAFGYLSMAMAAGWYYIVPRLTKAKIHSERLGNIMMVIWNLVILAGTVTLQMGITQSRPFAEYIWPIDAAVMILLLATGYNLMRTIMARKVEHLYVSLWYIMGTLIWFPIVYFIGNVMWAPPEGALTGLNDAIWNWFYGHNVLGLWFTTGCIALIYYIVPKEIKKPIYGYALALIAFWGLAFFYTAVGTHHILQSPVPEWLKTISVITSMGMLIPVFAFIINIFMTMRGSWRVALYSLPLRFALTAAVFYMLVSFQGATQALREFNQYIHFSNWVIAHAHLALTGFAAFTGFGMIYYILPRILKTPMYSERLGWIHWWLTTLGFIGFFSVLTAAGLQQAGGWSQGIPFITIIAGVVPMWIGRALFGSIIVVAQYIFAYNVVRTLLRQQTAREKGRQLAPDSSPEPTVAAKPAASKA